MDRLARNLYTSSARLVFELLQNADDNHYTKARACDEAPFVAFHVFPNRIVVECNEDGFTPENLTAICNVGKSSKTGAQGYIGEKGIGFKSVFMAAYKAYIQSGNRSFYFQHRDGGSGMGMITPIWQDTTQVLGDKLTRITLSLHNKSDPASLAQQKQTIRQQFQEIQETILLFMKNIERIEIAFYDDPNGMEVRTSTTTFTVERQTDNRVVVKKSTLQDGVMDEDSKCYHITKHMATSLARNENRTYSNSEEASQAYSRAEIVLAFPLTSSSVPILGNQWIFAFLPVRQMGFNVSGYMTVSYRPYG